ncbi:FKBP-type peptidyl-prolyl cis-trans isomerase [Aequorivita sinensis]|uniref:FKBP-type peptidyl-prolyl cis-trans isomerase n=1 Tax=Aequorivita sinensis TaxID=1382458 RepID=UPI0023017D26|nr:hypothetical protein [Aequorivita sinensis]
MMTKIKYGLAIFIAMLTITVSCKKDEDDGPEVIPPRDRGEEAIRAQAEIEEFLETHFYNYEDFQADPENFKLVFDTIAGDNASKTPLIEQVSYKEVIDAVDMDVKYKLYYLKVREGAGEQPNFSDYTINTYDGRFLNLELFDNSVIPVRFSLVDGPSSPGIIRGLQQAIIEFKGAGNIISNPDGTLSFEDYGIGAVFVPSGLGYYQYPPAGDLLPYDQLIFSFELFASEVADHDNDGIPSYMEDLNNNQILTDDDTDDNGVPNYLDNDDDGDGRLTEYEIEIIDGEIFFPDTNGNGIPDYLDPTV